MSVKEKDLNLENEDVNSLRGTLFSTIVFVGGGIIVFILVLLFFFLSRV